MTSTRFQFLPRLRSGVGKSPPDTPPVTRSPLRAFRQLFDPKVLPSRVSPRGPASSSPSEAKESSTDSLLSPKFDCGICWDTLTEESIERLDPCGHSFCTECVRGLIASEIESRHFPVLCPTCTAEPENHRPESIGKVTQNLVLEIGITQEEYNVWAEMEIEEVFVLLECRRCGQSSYLDREVFDEAQNLHCPIKGCGYVWCKECQQEFFPNGPEHSCDGSSELKRLVEQKGWKYCPVCNTPCEKIDGCSSVYCIGPKCKAHFCYNCGGWMTRPATAVSQKKIGEESRCRC